MNANSTQKHSNFKGGVTVLPDVLNCQGSTRTLQDVEDDPGPVAAIAELAQIGEGLLGGANALLQLGQLVAEGDEELAVALTLVRGQG